MISRVLFSKLLKNEIKRKLWVFAILLLVYIWSGPVMVLIQAENTSQYTSTLPEFIESMESAFKPDVLNMIPPMILAAILAGISGYMYLFSKNRTDLYHSLPVKRDALFSVNYVSGFINYFVVVLIKYVANIIIAFTGGYFTPQAFHYMNVSIAGELVFFFFFYNVMIIAIMLTGTIITSFLGFAALNAIYPLYSFLIHYLKGYSYVTMYTSTALTEKVPYFSPFSAIAEYVTRFFDGNERKFESGKDIAIYLCFSFIVGLVCLCVAYYLYKIRKSEAAGKAISFNVAKPYIRMPLAVLGGLIGAVFACTSTNKFFSVWIYIWLVFGIVLVHMICQVIFESDFKAICKNVVQMVICIAAGLIIVGSIAVDLFGYDKYIPDREKIVSATVALRGIDTDLGCVEIADIDSEGRVTTFYTETDRRLKKHMFTSDEMIDLVYELNKLGLSYVDKMKENRNNNEPFLYKAVADAVLVGEDPEITGSIPVSSVEVSDDLDDYREEFSFSVMYTMKNGREVARNYTVSKGDAMELISKVYEKKEYKRAHFDIYDIYETGAINNIDVMDTFSERQMSVLGNEVENFMKIYLSELENTRLEDIKELPIAIVTPRMKTKYNYFESLSGYYIYPSYKNTLAFLEEHNVNMKYMTSKIDKDDIESIYVNAYDFVRNKDTGDSINVNGLMYASDNPDDEAMMQIICDNARMYNIAWSNDILYDRDYRVEFYINYKFDGGVQRSSSAYMRKEDMPKEIIDAIIEYAAEHPMGY